MKQALHRRFGTLLLSLSALTLAPTFSSAQSTFVVPSSASPTIQSGIDAAVDGDVVLVQPGTYRERALDFRGKRITVKSAGGPEVTRIDAQKLDRVLLFLTGETSSSVFDGFDVVNGRAPTGSGSVGGAGGAGLIRGSSPTIRNCIFTLNYAGVGSTGLRGGRAGALYVYDGANPRIESCLFRFNSAGTGGIGATGARGANSGFVGIRGKDGGDGGDAGDGGWGGAIYVKSAQATIASSVFFSNTAGQGGTGGTGGRGGDGYKLFGAWTSRGGDGGRGGRGGDSGSGSAIYVDTNSSANVVNCSFGENYCFGGGGRGAGGYGGQGTSSGTGGFIGDRGSEGEFALLGASAGAFRIENSIAWGNRDERQDRQLNGATVSYSNVERGVSGTGNIDEDPMWDATPGSSRRRILEVCDGSPCIDAATSTPQTAYGALDVLGNPRTFDHPLIGPTGVTAPVVDMGAYEFLDGFTLPFGCGVNPAGSLTVSNGKPVLGATLSFALSNPYLGQAGSPGPGALPVLLLSFSQQSGCGIPLAGFGLEPGTSGGFYLGLDDLDGLVGAPWTSGSSVGIDAPIPNAPQLIGVSLFVQGVLVGGGVGLTNPLELLVGP